jgi:hypothetical protein
MDWNGWKSSRIGYRLCIFRFWSRRMKIFMVNTRDINRSQVLQHELLFATGTFTMVTFKFVCNTFPAGIILRFTNRYVHNEILQEKLLAACMYYIDMGYSCVMTLFHEFSCFDSIKFQFHHCNWAFQPIMIIIHGFIIYAWGGITSNPMLSLHPQPNQQIKNTHYKFHPHETC